MRRLMMLAAILALVISATPVFAATAQGPIVGPQKCTLQWKAPTTNQDGSALTDLNIYQIFISTTAGAFTAPYATLAVANPAPAPNTTVTYDCKGYTGGDGQRWATIRAVDLAGNPSVNGTPDATVTGGSVANGIPFVFDSVPSAGVSGLLAQ